MGKGEGWVAGSGFTPSVMIEQDEIYIIHRRPFKESSVILECFSYQHGILSLLAKGARSRGRRSRFEALLQPFICLEIEWGGRAELKTLFKAEAKRFYPRLKQDTLMLGLYLNELLMRLLQKGDPYPRLFQYYHDVLERLEGLHGIAQQQALRQFECRLLEELGYGLSLEVDGRGEAIQADVLYGYDPKRGIHTASHRHDPINMAQDHSLISGAALLALRHDSYSSDALLKEVKQWMRFVIRGYLGGRPLATRQLYFRGGKEHA